MHYILSTASDFSAPLLAANSTAVNNVLLLLLFIPIWIFWCWICGTLLMILFGIDRYSYTPVNGPVTKPKQLMADAITILPPVIVGLIVNLVGALIVYLIVYA